MNGSFLLQAAVFLAAAAIAAPIAKQLKISSVLGYLAAGVLIGPYGLGFVYAVYQVEGILHFAEFGVVLLLFLIGLELRPRRLWTMRQTVFGLGSMQVAISALALWLALTPAGLPWRSAVFVALALSLSSTAFVLQVLEEKGELVTRHGRAAFSILLFQDLAAIPLIALVPLFAVGGSELRMGWLEVLQAIGAIAAIIIVGRFLLARLYRLVALTGVREALTASALLTVVVIAIVMDVVGLSAALGAFIAGALLAESEYRHEIEADIAPFEGLLLGLFFTAVGMSLNLNLLGQQPGIVAAGVGALLAIKAAILFMLGRWQGLSTRAARRLALAVSQGGEFAFVLFTAGVGADVLQRPLADLLTVIVTLSMLATPLLLLIDDLITGGEDLAARTFDTPPNSDHHVIIAGFGRFGQIVARILQARRIPFTALDHSVEQVDFVSRFGNKIYYGDASRLDILQAAQTGKARAFVLAIDAEEASLRAAQLVRQHFPNVPVFARARNRRHAHLLMDAGVEIIRRETFLSALDLTQEILVELGLQPSEARRTVETFKEHDERRLHEDYKDHSDFEKMRRNAMRQTEELEELFLHDESASGEIEKPEDKDKKQTV